MYYIFCPKAIVNQIELEFRLKSIDSFIVSGCFRQGFFSSSRNQILLRTSFIKKDTKYNSQGFSVRVWFKRRFPTIIMVHRAIYDV